MKACLRLTLFAFLLLPITLTAAEKPVRIPNYNCRAGEVFTLRIPVNTGGLIGMYEWYRNDTIIPNSSGTLMGGNRVVVCTIPGSLTRGDSVRFYFKYLLGDGCDEWTLSPTYVMSFPGAAPVVSAIAGEATVCAGDTLTYSVDDELSTYYTWAVPNGWTIVAGQGTYRLTVRAGTTADDISVTPRNGWGDGIPSTLAVAVNQPSTLTHTRGATVQTICRSTAVDSIFYTFGGSATGASISWYPIAPEGIRCDTVGDTIRVSGTPLEEGTFSYTITTSGHTTPCVAATATGTLTVHALPAQPGMISGSTAVCAHDAGLSYSVTNVPGTTYSWVLPAGWIRTAGQNSNSITVTADTAGGTIRVTPTIAATGCTGAARELSVGMNGACVCTTVAPGSQTVAACNGVGAVGNVSVAACSGVRAVGSISVAATCNGVTTIGSISSVAVCSGVSTMGSISAVAVCSGVSAVGRISGVSAAD